MLTAAMVLLCVMMTALVMAICAAAGRADEQTERMIEKMTYDEAMAKLSSLAHLATKAAGNIDGAPCHALREIAAEIDCLVDHNCTRKELADMKALYEGAKRAGLTG